MAEEISGEDGVAPGRKTDADFLEEPTCVGAIAMGHVNCAFDSQIQGQEALREDLAVWSVEVGLGVSDALGRVILLLRHVAPEVGGRFGRHG